MSEETEITEETTTENDGRSIEIAVEGAYKVKVSGEPEDSLTEVMEKIEEAAHRACEDIEVLREEESGNRYSQ